MSPFLLKSSSFSGMMSQKRTTAKQTISYKISELGGRVLQECVLSEIGYHGLLSELPRNAIESLVDNFEAIALSQVDDIMFFRPTCQSIFISLH